MFWPCFMTRRRRSHTNITLARPAKCGSTSGRAPTGPRQPGWGCSVLERARRPCHSNTRAHGAAREAASRLATTRSTVTKRGRSEPGRLEVKAGGIRAEKTDRRPAWVLYSTDSHLRHSIRSLCCMLEAAVQICWTTGGVRYDSRRRVGISPAAPRPGDSLCPP